MAEENKQEVEVKEAEQQPKGNELDEESKYSLITFILTCAAVAVCYGWIVGGVACGVLGIICLQRLNGRALPNKQPYRTFDQISKPVSIANIVIGFVVALAYTIKLIVDLVH